MAKCKIELDTEKLEEICERFKEICEREMGEAKDKQIEWLESFAAAFLIVAYGEDVREIKMSQDKILKLMTAYKLEMNHDPETGDWIFNVSVSEKEKKS